MTSAIFKSTGAIITYILIGLGLLSIAGYNFWGWFGGSEKWKANNSSQSGESGEASGRYGNNISERKVGGSINPVLPNKCQHDLDCHKYYTQQLNDSVNQSATMGITDYKISVLQDRYTYLQQCLNS